MKIIIILIICLSLEQSLASCPLKWVLDYDGSYPNNSVFYHSQDGNEKTYIVRVKMYEKDTSFYVPGRLDIRHHGAYIPYYGEKKYSSYEVLTNPSNCILNWVHSCCGQLPENAVGGAGYEKNAYVAREIGSHQLPGKMIPEKKVVYVSWGGIEYYHDNYQVLTSTGLQVLVRDIKYDIPPISQLRNNESSVLIGENVLNNMGNSTLKQTVKHSNSITQIYSFEFSESWSHTFNVTLNAAFPINVVNVGIRASYEYKNIAERKESYYGSVVSNVEVERVVEVPPYSKVKVSDYVSISKDVPIDFRATADFYGEGMTGEQVKAALGNNFEGKILQINSDYLRAEITGKFSGTWALSIVELVEDLQF